MAGRAPKSARLHVINGNPQNLPAAKLAARVAAEPVAPGDLTDPPDWLTDEQKDCWNRRLVDGLPLNDPFGGWVYWARVPRLALERIEVLRGGASDLYGSGALGGVVQLVTREASAGWGIEAEASVGGATTPVGSLTARGTHGDWSGRVSAQAFRTDGYVPVDPWSRGDVDTEAAYRHAALDATLEKRAFGDGRVFLRAMAYGEDRENLVRRCRRTTPGPASGRSASTGARPGEGGGWSACGARRRSSTRPSVPCRPTARART